MQLIISVGNVESTEEPAPTPEVINVRPFYYMNLYSSFDFFVWFQLANEVLQILYKEDDDFNAPVCYRTPFFFFFFLKYFLPNDIDFDRLANNYYMSLPSTGTRRRKRRESD
jgi:hypothetical protein